MNIRPITVWIFFGILFIPGAALAATLSLSPSSGTFMVGSTFEASLFLNTEGKSVNALDITLSFPAEKLQLVSPPGGELNCWCLGEPAQIQ